MILAITDPMFIRRVQTLGGESQSARGRSSRFWGEKHITSAPGTSSWIIRCSAWALASRPSTFHDMAGCTATCCGPKDAAAHNMYLQILAETGLVGFAAFLLIMRAVVRPMFALRKYWAQSRPEYAHTLTSLMLGVLLFLVTSIFPAPLVYPLLLSPAWIVWRGDCNLHPSGRGAGDSAAEPFSASRRTAWYEA